MHVKYCLEHYLSGLLQTSVPPPELNLANFSEETLIRHAQFIVEQVSRLLCVAVGVREARGSGEVACSFLNSSGYYACFFFFFSCKFLFVCISCLIILSVSLTGGSGCWGRDLFSKELLLHFSKVVCFGVLVCVKRLKVTTRPTIRRTLSSSPLHASVLLSSWPVSRSAEDGKTTSCYFLGVFFFFFFFQS